MPCCEAVVRRVSYAQRGAKLVQEWGVRLVQVRAAPQRSVSIGQRASAVHGRCAFVHGCALPTLRVVVGSA
ncbi:hypothetical protein R75461_01428 [Paraburkholderia nemoris]|jgi:hypothetical protein|nr:hypothetical protein ADM96_32910 [Burkholderia sp. ST111]CAE6707851.1 hypothetical protein LMG22931_01118 [Paraburkholderia nemoris]CAE6719283.1 hypothetical protein R75461_01428 [Paraburkholderia nemoris]